MSKCSSLTISPHERTTKRNQTVANVLSAVEHKYQPMAQRSPAAKRLLSAFRVTCKRLSEMLGVPLECIYLDELVEIDAALIAYIEGLGTNHQSAVQYACDKNKLLDEAYNLGLWTSEAYELRRSWVPIRLALRGKAHGCVGIIEMAIKHERTPATFTVEITEHWKQQMLGRGRSLLTILFEERYWRTTLRRAGLQSHFLQFSLASKNPLKFRLKLKNIPEPIRHEILEAVRWKTADEDLDDRDAELMIRLVTGENLTKHLVEVYSHGISIPGIGDISDLSQLISEKIVCGFIDRMQENGRCKPQSIIAKLSSIYYLTRTYPKLKNSDYGWFRAKLKTLRKETNARVQTRKLDGLPDYEEVADIVLKLLALRSAPCQLSEVAIAWIIHDALIFLFLLNPHRSRNIREAAYHSRKCLNIFETEISSELLTQIKLPAWAKELRDKDPKTARFVVGHWLEHETKANSEVWVILAQQTSELFKEYVKHYRPVLLRNHDSNATNLFFARNLKPLTQKTLLDLVRRICMRHTGKNMTVKSCRDLVAAHLVASTTVDEVAKRLWNLDPYSTTARYYIGGFNASDGVVALEDEFPLLAQ